MIAISLRVENVLNDSSMSLTAVSERKEEEREREGGREGKREEGRKGENGGSRRVKDGRKEGGE